MHYGVKYRSGRYPYGSGDNPYQHSGDFLSRARELKKSGMTEKEIAEALGFRSTGEYRSAYSIARNDQRRLDVARAKSLSEDGLGATEIGRIMGKSESTIRSLLNPDAEANMDRAMKTAETLKKEIKEKHILDVGVGVERELGVSGQKLEDALGILAAEGYIVTGISLPQMSDPKKRTTVKVVCEPGRFDDVKAAQAHLYNNPADIMPVGEYHSVDGGKRWDKRERPSSISSDRVQIRYGDEGGLAKDGVIEIRRGVPDLDLGKSHYAQVRIMVDGTHYLKGMAMYSDDIPDGVDIVFNTNKSKGTEKMEVLKPIKDDPDNPFGAYIKADGQSFYPDPKGKYKDPITGERRSLSAINKLKEEGDWDKSSKNLSSQFLSKQPMELINKQLKLTYADHQAEFEAIKAYTNPTVKKQMLLEFSRKCDAAAIHLQAAALPRQETRVILPVTKLKDNEIYAPYLKNGERVVLIRYPHAGTFELPELVVNNRNPSAKSILGNVTDAVGINSKVAERLSGADFDGDTVVVIPVNNKVRINTTRALRGLENFEPKVQYSTEGKTGVRLMKKSEVQNQMGTISNLITDMTLRGAPESDIVKAVKHSMVIIDAYKHKLDYKQSEIDNDISTLKKRWQLKYDEDGNVIGSGGASTLISKHKQTISVPERKGSPRIDPDTGELIYKQSGRTYLDKKGDTVQATTRSPLITETPDIRTLSSGTRQENAYADYANKVKALANQARKEWAATPGLKKSSSAAKTYKEEVDSLMEKLDISLRNSPKERRALALANSMVKAKIQDNPELSEKANKDTLAKVKRTAMDDARVAVGAKTKKIEITDREWEAIQAGAISDNTLSQILRFTDSDAIKQRAMPKTTTSLSTAQTNKIKAMQASGYTIQEIAEAIGASPSTVSKYLRS